MDAQQFAYWLQGFAELNEHPPSPEQWASICEHLATVFVKVTSPLGIPDLIDPSKVQRYPIRTPADPRWFTECKGGALSAGDGALSTC